MPTITLSKTTALGDIGEMGASRQSNARVTGGNSVQADLQSVQTEAQMGSESAAFGAQQVEQGKELLQPLLKLAQAREVMQALGIGDSAVLQARSQVQSLKTSGTHYTEWMPEATKQVDTIFADAIKKVATPAGKELVMREFRQERLNLLTKVQGEAVDEEINAQRAQYAASTMKTKADYYATDDPLQRSNMQARQMGMILLLENTGVLKKVEAEKERQNWYKFQWTNDAINTAKKEGLTKAFANIDANSLMTPEDRSEARTAAHTAVQYDLQAQRDAERQAEKHAQEARTTEMNKWLDAVYSDKVTTGDLNVMEAGITGMTEAKNGSRQFGDHEATTVRSAIRKRKDELLNPPTKDDNELALRVKQEILYNPQSMDATQLRSETRLTRETRERFLQEHKDRLASNHFTSTFGYKQLVDQIKAAAPSETKSIWTAIVGNPNTEGSVLAITQLYDFLTTASKDTQGVLTTQEVLQLASPYVDKLSADLKARKAPTAGLTFEQIGNQRVK